MLVTLLGCASSPTLPPTKYPGGAPPSASPKLFAPGLISTGLSERDSTLSPDGDCFAYTLQGAAGTAIVVMECPDGVWDAPEMAPFSGRFADSEPCFDPRGDRLWFASRRPLPGEDNAGDANLWFVSYIKTAAGRAWGSPQPATELNTDKDEFYPSVSLEGEVVFTAEREGGQGGEDLWLATRNDDRWNIINAGPGVNTPGAEFNCCIRPDGGALIFSSVRPGDQGRGDLYISRRQPDGSFGTARPLKKLNSTSLDYCPSYSPCGTVLWFTSRRRASFDREQRWPSLAALRAAMLSAGNGQGDVYWVRADAIEE